VAVRARLAVAPPPADVALCVRVLGEAPFAAGRQQGRGSGLLGAPLLGEVGEIAVGGDLPPPTRAAWLVLVVDPADEGLSLVLGHDAGVTYDLLGQRERRWLRR
jgi:hypothetical protein